MVKVIKRDCTEAEFQKEKISNAILKAMKNGSGIVKPKIAEDIADEIYEECKDKEEISISDIENMVYDKLISKKQRLTAKAYEGYRSIREFQRDNANTTDEQIAELLDGTSDYWNNENSNKNSKLVTVQRDYMAGIVSTDITRRYLLSPEIVQAHDEGIIHFHDADYFGQNALHNCFSSDTEFVTSKGLRKFSDFNDGDIVVVLDKDGCWRKATVHQYGKQEMFDVTFKSGRRVKKVTCTSNHRWILKNGKITTNLKVGDSLIGLVDSTNLNNPVTYDEYNMFAIGFLIGDGCDHGNFHQIRLCGEKNKYAEYFKKAGYRLEKIKDSNDYIAYKKGSLKQEFLNSKPWKYMDLVSRRMLFYGLYCADGDKKRNRLCTTDDRVAEFIRDNCYLAGYHLTSEFVEHRNTNYKENSKLINFLFSKSQPINQLWKVTEIKPHYDYRYEDRNNKKELNTPINAWCVEEPITHSFTLSNGMVTGNCELINLEDMLQNGTVINGVQIDKPHRLITAVTIATQAITAVTSSSYGGATINLAHLAPFVRDSYNKYLEKYRDRGHSEEDCIKFSKEDLVKEINDAVQTFNYQCNSMTNTNGQSPFLSVFMYLNDTKEYKEELAMLIEEFLKQRIQGLKNTVGVYVTQAFPKLLYVLEKDNITEDSKYWYLTKLAAQCTAKRLTPDYISEKIMLETKIDKNGDGNCYGCMGCVDGKEIITYRVNNQLFVESFERMWNRLTDTFEVKHQYSDNNPNLYMDLNDVEIYDTEKGFVNTKRIIRNVSNNWVDVHLSNGRRLLCTSDHPFEVMNKGVIKSSELNVSDKVLINSNQYNEESVLFNTDKAWLLGFMLCDGCYQSNHIFASIAAYGEDEIEKKFHNIFPKYFGLNTKTVLQERGKRGTYKDLIVLADENGNLQYAINYFTSKFGGINKVNRHIPNEVFSWNYEAKMAFLAGMIDADGYLNDSGNFGSVVQIGSTNKELALQQMALAQALGIPAKIYHNHYTKKNPNAIRYRVEFYAIEELLNYIVCNKKCEHYEDSESYHFNTSSEVIEVLPVTANMYSYDVTTDSEHFEVSGIYSHNCRSFLTPYIDENGKPKYWGRFNQGVVTINLPDIAFSSEGDFDKFWDIFEERTELCHKALKIRHERLEGTPADVAPILWRYGALARLESGETIDKLLHNGYSTISLGYAGLYECVKYMTGCSHSDGDIGEKFGLQVMQALNDKCNQWKNEENIDYSLYGTPMESGTYKFAKSLKRRFGDDIFIRMDGTDRKYITNSYHIPVFEEIDPFKKLETESKFQRLSPGGAISYIETSNMNNNIDAVLEVMKFIYENIMYAELNTKSDYCQVCGFDGEIKIIDENNQLIWECPNCGNRDKTKMNVARRTCGYIGTQFWNQGRTDEILHRYVHLDDHNYKESE